MKLLFLTPQLPYPLDQGTKLRNHHLIRIAAEAGHDVHLLTFAATDNPLSPRELPHGSLRLSERGACGELERWCRRIVTVPAPPRRPLLERALAVGLSSLPDLLLRRWSPAFREALIHLLAEQRYDLVQVEGLELSPYLAATHSVLTVFDDHNVEHLLQERAFRIELTQPLRAYAALYSLIQWRRLRRLEARVCARADAVLAVSERDAATLRALSGREVVSVPNGIDLAATPFREPPDQASADLLFDGVMSFRPNNDAAIWFSREILPLVRKQRSDARFWVVGRDPTPELVAFNFHPNGVAVTGAVSDVKPYYDRAGLYVLPMRMGSGVRFKALGAMARGLPLVSTELGVEGIGAEPGRDYLRAEQPKEFVAAIVRLLDDTALRCSLAVSARRTVAAYDWDVIGTRLLDLYRRLELRRVTV